MKYINKLFVLIILSLLVNNLSAQERNFSYLDSWGKAGYNLMSSKSTGVEIIYSIPEFSIKTNDIKGEALENIVLPGVYLFNDAGMPDLPGNGRMIAIPEGSTPKLKIIDYQIEVVQNVNIAPAPVLPMDTETEVKYEKNQKVFSENKLFPENPFQLSEVHQLRGVDYIMLGITPFQYNPVTKELIVYRNLKISIEFEGGKSVFGDDRLRNIWWEPILEDALINYSSLGTIDLTTKTDKSEDGEYEYVIITIDNPQFVERANTIAEFRRKQGISTGVFTISEIGGNTVSAIENWVNTAYNTWENPPVAVLLMADYATNANGITSPSYNHPYDGTYITDNTYADVDGDFLPDIVFARMSAENTAELDIMVSKFINYETNPPTSFDFYDHPISALGWQDDRWFQICSEVIAGFWKNELGKNPVRINALGYPAENTGNNVAGAGLWSDATNTTNVINYFGTSGLNYIPDKPGTLGGFTGGTATMVNTALNNGAFILQHRDHGAEDGWGEPAYANSNINGLTNTDLSFIMSINCLTGRFDYSSEVFAEKFHSYTYNGVNSGALGLIAATQVSYSYVNDVFVWGAYDNMWPEFMPSETANPENRMILPAFANVAGKNFLESSSWPYNEEDKEITYNLFHHHGDAFLNVYSDVPQNLTVNTEDVHIFGSTQLSVTADEGAFIAVTYLNSNTSQTEIIGTALSADGETNIQLSECPPVATNILVTITKQNFFRYTKEILVIAPNGPYIICNSKIINDGNNGLAEYNETFNMDITLKNVGTESSQNITATITESDDFITLGTNNSNITFENLASNQISAPTSNKFQIIVANNATDQHVVNLTLTITDNSSTYTSNLSFKINAPKLDIGNIILVDNDDNGDGILDPGENADLLVSCSNLGHADISNVIGNIECINNMMTINNLSTQPVNLTVSESSNFIFNVTASEDFALGTEIELNLNFTGGLQNQYSDLETSNFIVGYVPEYCLPNYSSGTSYDDFIDGVVLENLINTNTGSVSGPYYNDYTNLYANLSLNTNYTLEITAGTYSGDDYAAWIDYNYNGDFEDNEKLGEITLNANASGDISFTVPNTVTTVKTRMRVICAYTSSPVQPCSDYTYGEIEDYTIYFSPIQIGEINASISDICESGTSVLTLQNYACETIEWQKSTDQVNWENLTGTNQDVYTTENLTENTYFRAELSTEGYPSMTTNYVEIRVFEQTNAHFTISQNNLSIIFTNNSTNADTFLWSFGDNLTSTAQNPMHVYSAYGEYEVVLSANNQACEDIYSETVSIVNGIEDMSNSNFKIYPNPTSGLIYISNPKTKTINILITDITGKEIYKINSNKIVENIDLSYCKAGIYFINVFEYDKIYTKQFIIN